jgi:hypothetical protein
VEPSDTESLAATQIKRRQLPTPSTKKRRGVSESSTHCKRSKTVVDETQVDNNIEEDNVTVDYRTKKQMSAKILKYFVAADEADQVDLGVTVNPEVQHLWRHRIQDNTSSIKLHDVGDALLHCLNGILCTSNYMQLVPSAISLHANRTIVIAVLPQTTCWVIT